MLNRQHPSRDGGGSTKSPRPQECHRLKVSDGETLELSGALHLPVPASNTNRRRRTKLGPATCLQLLACVPPYETSNITSSQPNSPANSEGQQEESPKSTGSDGTFGFNLKDKKRGRRRLTVQSRGSQSRCSPIHEKKEEEYLVVTNQEESVFVLLVGRTRLQTAEILTFRSPTSCLECCPTPSPRKESRGKYRGLVAVGFEKGHLTVVDVGVSQSKVLAVYGTGTASSNKGSAVTAVQWLPGSRERFLSAHDSGAVFCWDCNLTEEIPLKPPTSSVPKNKESGQKISLDVSGGTDATATASSTDNSLPSRRSSLLFKVNSEGSNPLWTWFPGGKKSLEQSRRSITSMRFSPTQSNNLAITSLDGSLRIANTETFEILCCCRSWFGGFLCVAWSNDGQCIATGGEDDAIHVWKLNKCNTTNDLKGNSSKPTSPIINQKDSARINESSNCEMKDTSEPKQIENSEQSADHVLFSLGQPIVRGEAHENWVRCIYFDHFWPPSEIGEEEQQENRYRLVSVAEDGSLAIWEIDVPKAQDVELLRKSMSVSSTPSPQFKQWKVDFDSFGSVDSQLGTTHIKTPRGSEPQSSKSDPASGRTSCSGFLDLENLSGTSFTRIKRPEVNVIKPRCYKIVYQLPSLALLPCRTGLVTLGEPSLVKFWQRPVILPPSDVLPSSIDVEVCNNNFEMSRHFSHEELVLNEALPKTPSSPQSASVSRRIRAGIGIPSPLTASSRGRYLTRKFGKFNNIKYPSEKEMRAWRSSSENDARRSSSPPQNSAKVKTAPSSPNLASSSENFHKQQEEKGNLEQTDFANSFHVENTVDCEPCKDSSNTECNDVLDLSLEEGSSRHSTGSGQQSVGDRKRSTSPWRIKWPTSNSNKNSSISPV